MARQESMFRNGAASHAGARGLLQLLPSTAKLVARRAGEVFDDDRLIGDPDYNAMLGGYYLETLLERFDGERALALAAYNAGPLRVRQWIEKHGDPRTGDPHDLIDWVELIPFTETRAYVQRVLEGYEVYKRRLADTRLALIDFPGGNGFGPPPMPMPRPRDGAASFAEATGDGIVTGPSHRPLFRPLAVAGRDGVSGEPGPAGERPKAARQSSWKTFDDRDRQRLAADQGGGAGAVEPSSEQAPKL
jgi:hypothetical protein